MPAIVGNVKIISVGQGAIVHFGDSIILAPISSSKTFAGAGSFNTGDLARVSNGISLTNTNDSDLLESNANLVGLL